MQLGGKTSKMNHDDIECPFCDSRFTVDCEDEDATVAFCPYCGEDLDLEDDSDDSEYEDDEE